MAEFGIAMENKKKETEATTPPETTKPKGKEK
jgi:hypothetical protein